MEITADRFLCFPETAIDLASAEPVRLRWLEPCDADDERRWSSACDRLSAVWHEDMPSLIDFGVAGGGERFEAYDQRHARVAAPGAPDAVRAFLAEYGLAGHRETATRSRASASAARLGIRLIPREAISVIAEALDDGRAGRPRCIVCTAEPGAGLRTFLRLAAMEGRRRGYVSVSPSALDRWPQLLDVLRDRHVLVLCGRDVRRGAGERWFLQLARATSSGHVLLGAMSPAAADARVRLGGFRAATLAGALSVYPPGALTGRDVRRAAVESGGNPGAFLAALRDRRGMSRALRVAEPRGAYVVVPAESPAVDDHPWADLLARADDLAARGRRAAAERDLRGIAAAAARRDHDIAAGAAETRLARLLLARGRLEPAEALLTSRVQVFQKLDSLAVDSALALAELQMERGSMEAAESILRAAGTVEVVRPALGLARCLAWQARHVDVERCLQAIPKDSDPSARAAADARLAAVALARGDLPAAARLAGRALAADGQPWSDTAIDAHETLLRVHAAVSDAAAVERHGRAALAACRRAGRLARLTRIRAAIVEARLACGAPRPRAVLDRLLALSPRVTPLSRARLWLLGARVHPVPRERERYSRQVTAFVAATGAAALLPAGGSGEEPPGEAVASLVSIHESATDPRALLAGTADWLLKRLDARGVCVVNAVGDRVAGAGALDRLDVSRRVLETRTAQPPWNANGSLEAAVLLKYSGRAVGALAVRWPFARPPARDPMAVMATAAAFVAPAVAALHEGVAAEPPPAGWNGIVGRSDCVVRLRDTIARAAASPFPVLIEGESGSGKELVARAIHAASPRRQRACVAVNCAALGDDLIEAELFGHARGAFTGAHADRPGLFEQADAGTLFLDEVSELSPRAQAKLLRALQDGEVRRVGENVTRRVDTRVVAASNRRLEEDAAQGRFRRDLLFRLAVVRIAVPPLRERREDIPLLVAHYWRIACERAGSHAALSASAIAALARHDWPGNVRELQNVMAALAVQFARGRVGAEHVAPFAGEPSLAPPRRLDAARRECERLMVTAALARCGGRHAAAARELGLTRQGLGKLLRRLGLANAG